MHSLLSRALIFAIIVLGPILVIRGWRWMRHRKDNARHDS